MKQEPTNHLPRAGKKELARRCLSLISEIAGRGARSRVFEPISADQIGGLTRVYEALEFVKGCSQDLMASALSRPN